VHADHQADEVYRAPQRRIDGLEQGRPGLKDVTLLPQDFYESARELLRAVTRRMP
jgi:hypothetical protein